MRDARAARSRWPRGSRPPEGNVGRRWSKPHHPPRAPSHVRLDRTRRGSTHAPTARKEPACACRGSCGRARRKGTCRGAFSSFLEPADSGWPSQVKSSQVKSSQCGPSRNPERKDFVRKKGLWTRSIPCNSEYNVSLRTLNRSTCEIIEARQLGPRDRPETQRGPYASAATMSRLGSWSTWSAEYSLVYPGRFGIKNALQLKEKYRSCGTGFADGARVPHATPSFHNSICKVWRWPPATLLMIC